MHCVAEKCIAKNCLLASSCINSGDIKDGIPYKGMCVAGSVVILPLVNLQGKKRWYI